MGVGVFLPSTLRPPNNLAAASGWGPQGATTQPAPCPLKTTPPFEPSRLCFKTDTLSRIRMWYQTCKWLTTCQKSALRPDTGCAQLPVTYAHSPPHPLDPPSDAPLPILVQPKTLFPCANVPKTNLRLQTWDWPKSWCNNQVSSAFAGTFDQVFRAPKLEHLQVCWPVLDTFGALQTWSNVPGGTWNLVYLQDLGQSQVWS